MQETSRLPEISSAGAKKGGKHELQPARCHWLEFELVSDVATGNLLNGNFFVV